MPETVIEVLDKKQLAEIANPQDNSELSPEQAADQIRERRIAAEGDDDEIVTFKSAYSAPRLHR